MIPNRFRHQCWISFVLVLLLVCGCVQENPAAGPQASQSSAQIKSIDPASQVTAEEVVTKTFSLGEKPKVAIEVFFGAIEIVAAKDDTIQATVTKRAGGNAKAEAEEALKEISLTFDENQGGIRIVARPPQGKPFSGGVSARLDVPAGASLELQTNLNRIDVAGIRGSIHAQNSQGPISIKDARGPQNLTTSLAQIDVEGSSDQIAVKNSQGGIVVRGATGSVDLTTSLAHVEVDGPATQATVKNSQGGIRIRRAIGTLDLTTSLAAVDVDAPCTRVTVQNSQGAITVSGAKGPLQLTTSLAHIDVKSGGANVEAVNSQGGITIHGATGRVKARTSLAQITVAAKDAVVEVENSQGGVTFTGSLAPGKHSFSTSQGNVSLKFPAQASFQIDVTASLGTIRNAFPLAKTEKSTPTNLLGTVGAQPKASVQVNVNQGSVAIEKAK